MLRKKNKTASELKQDALQKYNGDIFNGQEEGVTVDITQLDYATILLALSIYNSYERMQHGKTGNDALNAKFFGWMANHYGSAEHDIALRLYFEKFLIGERLDVLNTAEGLKKELWHTNATMEEYDQKVKLYELFTQSGLEIDNEAVFNMFSHMLLKKAHNNKILSNITRIVWE